MSARWNSLEYLDSEEGIEAYLDEARSFGDEEFYQKCLAKVETARMLTAVSKEIDFDRKSLCRYYLFDPAIVTAITNALRKRQRFERQLQQAKLEVAFFDDMMNKGASAKIDMPFSYHPVLQLQ